MWWKYQVLIKYLFCSFFEMRQLNHWSKFGEIRQPADGDGELPHIGLAQHTVYAGWGKMYFLFSFIKTRSRQKSAWQTRVRGFTAKEMGKSFLKTHFIWNTLSKITKSCVFLPHNPFISYLDKKSYFFLILDILPSSGSRLQENKILRKTFYS